MPADVLQSVEELLRYIHQDPKIQHNIGPENTIKDSCSQTKLLGNADVAIADALMTASVLHKNKLPTETARKVMLMAVSKTLREISFDNKTPPPAPPPESEWIKFDDIWDQTAVAAATTQAADDGETKAKVEVLEFDEKTGNI